MRWRQRGPQDGRVEGGKFGCWQADVGEMDNSSGDEGRGWKEEFR